MQDDGFRAMVAAGTVVVSGEIDLATAPRLRAALSEATDRRVPGLDDPLLVDLTAVGYLDSAAMAVLYAYTGQGLELVLVEGSVVERALDIGGLLDQVTVSRPRVPEGGRLHGPA